MATPISLRYVLVFAVLFRLIGFFTYPVLEDDFFRFMWDGYQTALTGTPYDKAPSLFFGTDLPEAFEDILDNINYPYVATIYGPTSEWLFYLAHQISAGQAWPLKLILLLADLGIIALLARHIPTPVLMLYAWSPLVIKEFVISIHPDLLGAFFMSLAVFAYLKKRDILLGVFLALATGVKLFAIIILPFLFLWRWRAWLGFCVTVLAIALPFGLKAAWFPQGLATMSEGWLFNAPIYNVLSLLVPTLNDARTILSLSFVIIAGGYGLYWAYQQWIIEKRQPEQTRELPRGDLLYILLFLCIPAFNPWYAIWVIPFALYWPRAWVWVGSVAILLSYASGINLDSESFAYIGEYEHPAWVLILEFSIIVLVFFISKLPPFKKRLLLDHNGLDHNDLNKNDSDKNHVDKNN